MTQLPSEIYAIDGLDDATQARIVLFQAGKLVHGPALGIGLQPLDADLTAIAALTPADRNIIVGNGSTWVAKNGQLPFPGSQNASADPNTLDDYEEGSTNPTVTSGTGSFTSVSCTLTYTKIGREVIWRATIVDTTNGTAATSFIVPLPFTAGAGAPVHGYDANVSVSLTGIVSSGTASATIVKYDGTYPGVSGRTYLVGGSYNV